MPFRFILKNIGTMSVGQIFKKTPIITPIKHLNTPITFIKMDHLNMHMLLLNGDGSFAHAMKDSGALVGKGLNFFSHSNLGAARFCVLPKISVEALSLYPQQTDTFQKSVHLSDSFQKFVNLSKENFLMGLHTITFREHLKNLGICIPMQISFPPNIYMTPQEVNLFFLFNRAGQLFTDHSSSIEGRRKPYFEIMKPTFKDETMSTLVKICEEFTQSVSPSFAEISIHSQKEQRDPRIKCDFVTQIDGSIKTNKTTALALLQTLFARALFYFPTHTIAFELSRAATGLQKLWGRLENEEKLALVTRLFGSYGFLPQENMIAERKKLTISTNQKDKKGKEVNFTADIRELGAETVNTMARQAGLILMPIMDRIMRNDCTAHDRAVIIALLGDIGSIFNLTAATGTPRSLKDTETLRHTVALAAKLIHTSNPPTQFTRVCDYSTSIKCLAGSEAIAPYKNPERGRKHSVEQRTGIFNMGKFADSLLGVTHNPLSPITWELGLISQNRLYAHDEPFVGHMSGSVAEILVAWEVLAGGSSDIAPLAPWDTSFLGKSNSIPGLDFSKNEFSHICPRSSATAAFLIANGFHSAVEALSGILAYQGQDSRAAMAEFPHHDAADIFGEGAATDLITEMLGDGIGHVDLNAYLQFLRNDMRRFLDYSRDVGNPEYKFFPHKTNMYRAPS